MINPNIPQPIEFGTVRIFRPVGCTRTNLSLHAFDLRTKELARETYIEFNGKMISCLAFKIDDNGDLILRVAKNCFEFIDAESTNKEAANV